MKFYKDVTVEKSAPVSPGIFELILADRDIAAEAKPGQFINLFLADPSKILPRPISICETDADAGRIRMLYRVTGPGRGTEELSMLKKGDVIRVMGPLGTGFPLDEAEGKKVILIGGGIGIPPMLETAKALQKRGGDAIENEIVLGYRTDCFLADEMRRYGRVSIATEDGSTGFKGTVLDAIRGNAVKGDLIFACGPKPMLRAVKEYAAEHDMPCWVSMEERMACGIGVCLGCICESTEVDPHSHVHNKRVCKDGPVFPAESVVL